jgi:hypothetical protein
VAKINGYIIFQQGESYERRRNLIDERIWITTGLAPTRGERDLTLFPSLVVWSLAFLFRAATTRLLLPTAASPARRRRPRESRDGALGELLDTGAMGDGASGRGGRSGAGRRVGEYELLRPIGSGAYSQVWLGRHRVRGTEVAVKEIAMERLSKKLRESLLSEVDILRRIRHDNVIALHDSVKVSCPRLAAPFDVVRDPPCYRCGSARS